MADVGHERVCCVDETIRVCQFYALRHRRDHLPVTNDQGLGRGSPRPLLIAATLGQLAAMHFDVIRMILRAV